MQTSRPGDSLQALKRRLIWLTIQIGGTLSNEWRLSSTAMNYRLRRRTPLFSLKTWYGGTGNNIQQILLALAHAKNFQGKVEISEAELKSAGLSGLLRPILADFTCGLPINEEFRSNFFHFTEHTFHTTSLKRMQFLQGCIPRRECLLSREWIEANLHQLAITHLRKYLKPPVIAPPPDDHIVIWIRSGELADLRYVYYVTNPLYFYKVLAQKYRHATIVTQASGNHALLNDILPLFDLVYIERLSFDDSHRDRGFEMLRQARNLATSGVSTFPLAAALLSERLENFHCSDAFMVEHLNPEMLNPKRVNIHIEPLPGFEEKWRTSTNRQSLLYSYSP